MPLKNGELSGPEIRKLIRGHNKLAQIKVPTGLDRDGLIKFLKSRKYKVDHKKQMLVDMTTGDTRGRKVTLATATSITKPKAKSDEQKAATKAKKDEKASAMKSKEDAIKAEGVKQGAALQRVVSKRAKAKAKPAPKVAPKVKEVKLDEKFIKGLKSGTVEELKEDFEEYFEERKGDARTLEKLQKKTDAASKKKVENLQMSMNILNLQMKAIQKELKSRSGGGSSNDKEGDAVKKPTDSEIKKIIKNQLKNDRPITKLKKFPGKLHINVSINKKDDKDISINDVKERIKDITTKISDIDVLKKLIVTFVTGFSDNDSQLRYSFDTDSVVETKPNKKAK
mgnify:CR=1 FL=1